MQYATLLLIGIRLIYAGKHSLKYFYTSVTGDIDLTGFTVGLIDDSPLMYFDFQTMRISPKTAWMKENEMTDYLDRQTRLMIREHNWFRGNYPTRSKGVHTYHTYQIMYGCEWDDETGETNGFRLFGYDGKDIMYFDLKGMKWISFVEQEFNPAQMCNNQTILLMYWKHYFETECVESLKKYLQFGKSSLEKTVSPQVSLLQKDPSSPVICHTTGFYPSGITIAWLKNQQALNKDVNVSNLLPNEDGTFQKSVTLTVEPEEWKWNDYSCVVEHMGKTVSKTLTEKEISTNNASDYTGIFVAVAVVFVANLLLVIGVVGYFAYQNKGKSAFDHCSECSSETATET